MSGARGRTVKTLGEIAIEAGLVNRASAAKAGRMAEERKLPLVVVLVRELGVIRRQENDRAAHRWTVLLNLECLPRPAPKRGAIVAVVSP